MACINTYIHTFKYKLNNRVLGDLAYSDWHGIEGCILALRNYQEKCMTQNNANVSQQQGLNPQVGDVNNPVTPAQSVHAANQPGSAGGQHMVSLNQERQVLAAPPLIFKRLLRVGV